MAIYRDLITGDIDRQEFENHLKSPTRKEGYIDVIMYTPDTGVQAASVTSLDKLSQCDLSHITDIDYYDSNTIATLEENLWLLNGRFPIYQGQSVNGYISNSVSDENGDFTTNPSVTLTLSHTSYVEDFSIILNSAVPSSYPKSIRVTCFDSNDTPIKVVTQNIEWQEPTGEVDEEDQPIYKTVLLDSLPSVNFHIDEENISYITIDFISTRFRHRRIRVSTIMFGKTIVLDQSKITNVDYIDKTSYVSDTLPSRVFKFDVNNYEGIYNVDNPDNGYVKLNNQTRVRFRIGYNVWGYQYDQNGYVSMNDGKPVMSDNQEGVEIEWDNWKELRLMDVSANANESATFSAGSLLDIMNDTYTNEYYIGAERTVRQLAEQILTFEGLDLNSIEWSSDGIKQPTYDGNNVLLPYDQWNDTPYGEYKINAPLPETSCKQLIQLLAFSVGATILIKDNGRIKFACLDITKPSSFTNHYEWDYRDFTSIPAADQLPSVSDLSEISIPKYKGKLDDSGTETIVVNGVTYNNCSVITTASCTSMNSETTYSVCAPVGGRIANDDTSGASLAQIVVYAYRGIITLGGYAAGTTTKVEVLGYPIKVESIQDRNITSDSLVLDTKIMQYDPSSYNANGTVNETDQIKRKYLGWYKKKFKYNIGTRGEPLVNAGDYAVIQTQFTGQMPVYILQNHWTFDGAWDGDMEVIALD